MRRARAYLPAALLLAGATLGQVADARAQFRYANDPAAGFGYAQTQAVAGATTFNRAAPFVYSPIGVGPFGPYGFFPTPTGGFLTGAANVISAQGQYEINRQQANLIREQVRAARMDNRRKAFDQMRYEQENTPTLAEVQERERLERLTRARNDPNPGHVWVGIALNEILDDIRRFRNQMGLRGAEVPLDPEILPHVNLTTGNASGNSTMFNNGGKLQWPIELNDERFDAERKNIDKLFLQATKEATGPDGASSRTMSDLGAAISQLHDSIDGAIDAMTPSENVRARRFANQLRESVRMLRDPNAINLINGRWAPRGNTVGELIDHMDQNGLRFGPATPADRPAYTTLHGLLVQYHSSLLALAGPSQSQLRTDGPSTPAPARR
jgi:hypothetical protein